jgi:hypothetical protein
MHAPSVSSSKKIEYRIKFHSGEAHEDILNQESRNSGNRCDPEMASQIEGKPANLQRAIGRWASFKSGRQTCRGENRETDSEAALATGKKGCQ